VTTINAADLFCGAVGNSVPSRTAEALCAAALSA
jgi:hypothetical protein